jgi:opacity protein-like surface antigen
MRRWWVCGILVLGLAAAAAPGEAASRYGRYRHYGGDNQVRFRLGLFTPEGDSEYWTDKELDFTGASPSDLEDAVGGIDFLWNSRSHVAFMVSGDFYEGRNDAAYRCCVDNFGDDIVHRASLEITPVTAGVLVRLAPDEAPVVPYAGAGGGAYLWDLAESGDFIDFTQPGRPIFDGRLEANGTALGWYALAGLEIPFSRNVAFFVEGRWHRADDDLGDDFEGFGKLDLSGRSVTGGLAWTF